MAATTVALVGAAGGAGTTRTCLESAALLARDGREVAVLDAAYDTQGLARQFRTGLDPDVTALVTEDEHRPLEDGLYDLPGTDGFPGRVAVCPARAPFARLASAKTEAAAQRLGDRVEAAASEFDLVLVDVAPLGSNPGVAAVDVADRVAVVAPHTARGVDAAQRMRGRLADVGSEMDLLATVDRVAAGESPDPADVDAAVPRLDGDALDVTPAVGDDAVAADWEPAVATLAAVDLDVELDTGRSLAEFVPGR